MKGKKKPKLILKKKLKKIKIKNLLIAPNNSKH
jgi:hypothetical protein